MAPNNNNPNNNNPDLLYLLSRGQLLLLEDARLNSLITAVANFYTTRNDQSTWGNFLRALAIELAKLDYYYAYDVVGKNPQFLTPPDIRRRWADPLYVSSNWPSQTQFDTDFKTMLIDLLAAYRMGSTVASIQDVIFAYTGKNIVVEELYKQIGTFFDQSDRNAIKVSVNVGGTDPLTDIQSLNQLQIITQSLYGAIDLAKPAHVGLEFTTIFGEGEGLDCWLSAKYLPAQAYDTLPPSMQAYYTVYAYVFNQNPVFWHPNTQFNQYSIITAYAGSPPTVYAQIALNSGTSGSGPIWNPTPLGTTVDGGVTWLNVVGVPPAQISIGDFNSGFFTLTSVDNASGGSTLYVGTITGGDSNAFAGVTFIISGFGNAVNNGTFVCLASSSQTLLLANASGTMEMHAATALASTGFGYGFTPYGDFYGSMLTPVQVQGMYQPLYLNSNCTGTGIDDNLIITFEQEEEPPFDPMLIQAPVFDPANPTTTIAAYGRRFTAALSPALWSALPTLTFSVTNTVADGKNATYTYTGGPLVEGELVTIQNCGRSAFNVTAKIKAVTSTTFQIPLMQILVSAADTGAGFVTPTLQSAYYLQSGIYQLGQLPPNPNPTIGTNWYANTFFFLGQTIYDTSGNTQIVINPGTSGTNQPTWNSTLNGSTAEPPTGSPPNALTWRNIGVNALTPSGKWIQILTANAPVVPTGEVANWDPTHPMGLLAPRLDQVWEISGGDQDVEVEYT
jgi:hypothetical protein